MICISCSTNFLVTDIVGLTLLITAGGDEECLILTSSDSRSRLPVYLYTTNLKSHYIPQASNYEFISIQQE